MNKGVMPPSESVLRARIEVFKEVGISTETEEAKLASSCEFEDPILSVRPLINMTSTQPSSK